MGWWKNANHQLNHRTFPDNDADVSLVRTAFPEPLYTTKIISCRRSINSKEPDSRANEVLITN